jgi:hypothetical protein
VVTACDHLLACRRGIEVTICDLKRPNPVRSGAPLNTDRAGTVPPFIGADLTDRYSKRCRPSDVCGLTPTKGGKLEATFWKWH